MTKAKTDSFRYTADVVALTPDGSVQLVERGWPPHQGSWTLPGWHVDPGETSLAAAARELPEETGVHVTTADSLRPIGFWDGPTAARAAGPSPLRTRPSSPPKPTSLPGTTPAPSAGGPWPTCLSWRSTTPPSSTRPSLRP
ncbi:hypothetical protein GCM10023347_07870 [Streptomyces chumphonensis]|uniref:NUDIX hydrolase n=1 Tax=Streptomyces chumphonensis TaxID=1214925 RepID=UPI00296407BA|nr:NUDIX domain-containing protein [Streptomyces chumphonensis]